jgi:hypothetical protein
MTIRITKAEAELRKGTINNSIVSLLSFYSCLFYISLENKFIDPMPAKFTFDLVMLINFYCFSCLSLFCILLASFIRYLIKTGQS